MIDDAGAAPAAAESLTPSQGSGGAEAQPDKGSSQQQPTIERHKESARASVDRAFAQVDRQEREREAAKNALLEVDPDALGKDDAAERTDGRDEKGRFKAKDAQPGDQQQLGEKVATDKGPGEKTDVDKGKVSEAPSRFSADAKAAWATVPDAVKGEVHRAFREMETGLSNYQQVFEPLKPYFQAAQERGIAVHDALESYVSVDRALVSEDPKQRLGAIAHLLNYAGTSPREYAALVMGQKPDQAQAESAAEIRQLKNDLLEMRKLLGGMHTSMQQSRDDQVGATVDEFKRTHPRMNEPDFMKTVIRLINTRMADDLQSAHDMADRLNPAPVVDTKQDAASAAANTQKPSDQTRKGQLSIAGPPNSGSDPAKRKPSTTAKESVNRAFAAVGL